MGRAGDAPWETLSRPFLRTADAGQDMKLTLDSQLLISTGGDQVVWSWLGVALINQLNIDDSN